MNNAEAAQEALEEFAKIIYGNKIFHRFEEPSCCIQGEVYGHDRFGDGSIIFTSCIKTISRNGDHLVAITQSDTEYLAAISSMDHEMELAFCQAHQQNLYATAGRTGYEEPR